jgi:Iap family predicted aminopeptidase
MVGELASTCPARLAGSAAEARAADVLAARFRALGLKVSVEAFPIEAFRDGGSRLELADGPNIPVLASMYSAGSGAEGRFLPLVEGGAEGGFAAARGDIVVLRHGSSGASAMADEAAAAGVAGLVFVDPRRESYQGLVRPHCPLPVVELGGSEARDLEARLASGAATLGRLVVRAATGPGRSLNVSALIPARKPATSPAAIIVGAHLDSASGPGAADDASGLACLAALARIFSEQPLDVDLWLVGFGAEEIGEKGSASFLGQWGAQRIAAMYALDTVGGGRTTMVYSLRGLDNPAVDSAIKAGRRLGMRVEAGASEGSDHLPFALAGIPAAFIMRLPEERRHSAEDKAIYIDGRALEETTALVASALRALSSSLAYGGDSPLPPRPE